MTVRDVGDCQSEQCTFVIHIAWEAKSQQFADYTSYRPRTDEDGNFCHAPSPNERNWGI